MDDLNYYDLIEYWDLTIKQKTADGTFQNMLHNATIKWFNNNHFEGTIIPQQSGASYNILSGYASNGPFNVGVMTFDVIADNGSVRHFHGDIIDEWSIFVTCISKGMNGEDDTQSRWSAFRYKKIWQDEEEDEDALICPYCDANINDSEGEGECEHVIAYTDPDCFSLDLEYPLMPKTFAKYKWPVKTLRKLFGNLYDVLEAYDDGLAEEPNRIIYFEKLMGNITCDFETIYYEFSYSPVSSGAGYYYFAENPTEVHRQLQKIINKLGRRFKKLEAKMNKEHPGCPYCGEDYKKTKCVQYVTHTDLVNYPRLPEKLKDKKWLQENLRKTFGELYDVLNAYEHGLAKEPNRGVYLKKILEKIDNCELKYYEQKDTLVVFADEKETVLEKLNELEKRLAWLFKGLAYAEGIKIKGNTKGR